MTATMGLCEMTNEREWAMHDIRGHYDFTTWRLLSVLGTIRIACWVSEARKAVRGGSEAIPGNWLVLGKAKGGAEAPPSSAGLF